MAYDPDPEPDPQGDGTEGDYGENNAGCEGDPEPTGPYDPD